MGRREFWEQWEGETPQEPLGYVVATLAAAAAVGVGDGHTYGSQLGEPGFLYLLLPIPWTLGCAEPQEPPKANPTGRRPK